MRCSSYVLYSITFLFREMCYTKHIIYNYSTVAGGTVTFFDVTGYSGFTKGTWYFQPVNDSCFNTFVRNDAFTKLCGVYYQINYTDLSTIIESCQTYFNHTCNLTSLSLHNITPQAPTTYKLVKNTVTRKQDITFYNLQIISIENVLPSQANYASRGSLYNTPIIATVILIIVITVIVYMQYHHKDHERIPYTH
ncbi:Rh07 [macacine betaherpesvirus 3]|nr:Rh07 [macacine betaherpesvirus 3]